MTPYVLTLVPLVLVGAMQYLVEEIKIAAVGILFTVVSVLVRRSDRRAADARRAARDE